MLLWFKDLMNVTERLQFIDPTFRQRQRSSLSQGSIFSESLLRNLNPLTPISDQDRISPYNINTISSRKVLRIKKNIN